MNFYLIGNHKAKALQSVAHTVPLNSNRSEERYDSIWFPYLICLSRSNASNKLRSHCNRRVILTFYLICKGL